MIVNTIHGEMDDSLLECRNGIQETPSESIHWIEYWLDSELVHRSVHLFIKSGITISGEVHGFN